MIHFNQSNNDKLQSHDNDCKLISLLLFLLSQNVSIFINFNKNEKKKKT